MKAMKVNDPRFSQVMTAALNREWARINELVLANLNILNATNEHGETPLHYLVVESDIEGVRRFIDLGADLNQTDSYGKSPLLSAVLLHNTTTASMLLAAGASTSIVGPGTGTAIECALAGDDRHMVKLLVESGADINQKNECGETVLHEAASCGDVALYNVLVSLGADTNVANSFDSTPREILERYSDSA